MSEVFPPRRIAVFETFRESFRIAWSLEALRMPMLWLPVTLRLVLMWMAGQLPDLSEELLKADPKHPFPPLSSLISPARLLAMGAMGILYGASALALNASWMRHLIRRETPTGAYFGVGFWRYAGYLFLTYLALAAITIALMTPLVISASSAQAKFTTLMLGLGMGALALGIAGWIGISALPLFVSAAVEDRAMPLKRSFAIMRGNWWRYVGGSLLLGSPIFIVTMFVNAATGGHSSGPVAQMIAAVIETPMLIFQLIVGATYMALVYRQLAAARPERRVLDV